MPYTTGTKTVLTLRKYIDGQPTDETKANVSSDPDYIPPYVDTVDCPIVEITTTTTTTEPTTTTTSTSTSTTTSTTEQTPTLWNLVTCPDGSPTFQSIGYNDAGISWSVGNVVLASDGICYEISSSGYGSPTLTGVSFFNNCTECSGGDGGGQLP